MTACLSRRRFLRQSSSVALAAGLGAAPSWAAEGSEPVREQGVVVYRLGPDRLGPERGGPVRFLVKDPTVCHTGELDECANVKYLSRIELTTRRGRDTRPTSEADHAALHQAQEQPPGAESR